MRVVVFAAAGFMSGCFVPGTTSTTSDTTDGSPCTTDCGPTTDVSTQPTGTNTTLAPGAPVIESVKLSATELTEAEPVTITVTISDVDGLSTVVGGNIRGPGDEVVAPFVQRADGVYDVTLTWTDVNNAVGIEFESDDLDLGLQVAFFDTGNLTGRSTLDLVASCGGTPNYACNGVCVDASTNFTHCGSCESTCDKGQECNAGSCEADWSECEAFASTVHSNCSELCGAKGEACTDTCDGGFAFNTMVRWSDPTCRGGSDYDFEQDRCDASYKWSTNGTAFSGVQCCCSIGAAFP